MNLLHDWQKILKMAWSIRLAIIAALFSGAEVVLPLFADAIPRGPFALASFIATGGAIIARLIAQPRMHADD